MLLERGRLDVPAAVRRVVGLQAQEPASPYVALWNRLRDFAAADLDAALVDHRVVKASLMRLTLHIVDVDDYPAFHDAMLDSLRASRLYDRRFTSSGLSAEEVDAFLPRLLDYVSEPRTRVEIEELVEAQFGEPKPRLWWALRTFARLWHAPVRTPWSFGSPSSFIAARRDAPSDSRAESVKRLVRRYLEGFGPASVQDVARFAMLRVPVIREAVQSMAGDLVELDGPDGSRLFDVPGGLLPPVDAPAPPRLLGMWDSVLLAYADRSRMIPPDDRKVVIRVNGDLLPTLLVDGRVAGVWRAVEGGIEMTAFRRLSPDAWSGLEAEAASLVAFLADREPRVYRRYGHWWKSIPGEEVRVLGA